MTMGPRQSIRFMGAAAFMMLAGCVGTSGDKDHASAQSHAEVITEVQHDTMPVPLSQVPPAPRLPPPDDADEGPRKIPIPTAPHLAADPVAQRAPSVSRKMPTASRNFEGIGAGFTGPAGTFTVNSAPPDTNGAVGPNHYVQTTNTDFAVFDKTGQVLYGPVQINTLFTGFGGGCEANNDGDPVVQYDQFADRWIISQFSVTTTPYLQCVAVSTSGDPMGTYNRYAFSFGNTDFNDYPKIGIWPDGYYFTFNIFANASSFSGSRVCAYDRASMLTGARADQHRSGAVHSDLQRRHLHHAAGHDAGARHDRRSADVPARLSQLRGP
jgi:hypothetical protein